MPQSYLSSKLAEAWLQAPLDGFTSWSMDQGSILESEARPWLSLELGLDVTPIGLCIHDNERCAASPDGIIGNNAGAEIKCCEPKQHVSYLLANKVPDQYLAQVHFSMFVTGFKQWKFVSYRRYFPNLVLTVERDEEIQSKIAEAVDLFLVKFDAAMKRMEELNGSPRPKRRPLTPMPPREPEFVSELPT